MSTLRVNTIQDSAGTGTPSINGLAKAWVNFNGTGTVAIRASFNVSSITDNGTGDYTVNFTNAMPDANYVASADSSYNDNTYQGTQEPWAKVGSRSASSARIWTHWHVFNVGYSAQDINTVNVAIFR